MDELEKEKAEFEDAFFGHMPNLVQDEYHNEHEDDVVEEAYPVIEPPQVEIIPEIQQPVEVVAVPYGVPIAEPIAIAPVENAYESFIY